MYILYTHYVIIVTLIKIEPAKCLQNSMNFFKNFIMF